MLIQPVDYFLLVWFALALVSALYVGTDQYRNYPAPTVMRWGLEPSARYLADTVNVAPGLRYDAIWKAREQGKWLIHCHIGHHTTNDNVETQGGDGLMMIIEVK